MKKKSGYILCFVLVAAVFVLYAGRLMEWQFLDGKKYAGIAESSSSFFVKLDGARGEILDVNGKPLAGSRTTYNVVMNALTMETNRNTAIGTLLQMMEAEQIKWVDRLPIQMNATGAFEFIADKESEITYLKSKDMLNMQDYATADECMAALTERYDCQDYSREEARNIISVRYGMTKVQFSRSEPYVIAEDVPIAFVQKISEQAKSIPGVETRVSTKRDYGDGTVAPHVIGSLGSITQEQFDAFAAEGNIYSSDNVSGYSYTEKVGQSGIESAFESVLRGKNGKEVISTGSEGDVTDTQVTETPVAGNNVHLTINKDLQRVLNESLARNVEASEKKDCVAGAAVVLDVETFGVLASSTYPTFDLEKYVSDDKYYTELLEDETKPLFNRAMDGVFTPGSVMKPAVGLAALEEGVIVDSDTVYCDGWYKYYKNDPLKCLGEHGDANIYTALRRSCNTFFCDVGRLLTIDKMEVYANLLSLGKKTGIEISESAGIMSNPREYSENHSGAQWVDGVTIQAAIGQADSMFSPLQLAAYCATIANDGVRMKTHLLSRVTDYDNKQTVERYEPQMVEKLEVQQKNLDIIQEGMRQVCETEGTAGDVFGSYGIAVAGKTGTAENPGHSDNTVFMAYAPYENPKIAVAVVIEYGSSGILSKSVAKDVFDCYFYGKTLEQKEKDAKAAKAAKADGTASAED